MDSYDSESGRIFQHLSRSTRSTYLCTAPTSKIQLKFVKLFAKLNIEYSIFCIFSLNFAILKPNFDEFFSEMTNEIFIFQHFLIEFCHFEAKIWWTFVGISPIFLENDEICRESRFLHVSQNSLHVIHVKLHVLHM